MQTAINALAQYRRTQEDRNPQLQAAAGESHPALLKASFAAILLGHVGWILTYITFIRAGHAAKTYAVPLAAILLNITWELYYATMNRPRRNGGSADKLLWATTILWLVLDAVILYQLVSYGRAEFARANLPQVSRYFFLIVAAGLAMAFSIHVAFRASMGDERGGMSGYIINTVMSILFIVMFFARPDGRGISYLAAWLKLLSTGLVSLGVLGLTKATGPSKVLRRRAEQRFAYLLAVFVFLFDAAYVYLVSTAQYAAR